jgi:hypothetical protein
MYAAASRISKTRGARAPAFWNADTMMHDVGGGWSNLISHAFEACIFQNLFLKQAGSVDIVAVQASLRKKFRERPINLVGSSNLHRRSFAAFI